MDEFTIQKITGSMKSLMSDLCVSDILPHLIQSQILSLNQVDEIEVETTQHKQVMKFVKILVTRGTSAYPAFCKSLEETGQSHLVEAMESVTQHQDSNKESVSSVTTTDVSSKVLASLQDELKEHYCRTFRYLSPIPWSDAGQLPLEDVYTALQVVRGVNRKVFQADVLQRQNSGSVIGMADIFLPHQENAAPRKILIEGEPGMGKSTLCYKLAYDWSRDSNNNAVEKFKFVVFLSARDMSASSNTSLPDVIKNHLLPEDFPFTSDHISSCLNENQKDVLFIIDGFDEMATDSPFINKLIQGKLLSKSSVLVTSRPTFMISQMKYFDSVLRNIGYSFEQRIEFIEKFASSLDACIDRKLFEDMKAKLDSDGVLHDIGRNPLNLSILCLLLCELNGELPSSLTDLYQEMHDFIIKRGIGQMEIEEDEFIEKLKPLYRIAYDNLIQGKHQFTSKQLEEQCDVKVLQQIGFFTKEIKISRFSQITYYNFTHKSFQEFFAALHISKQDTYTMKKMLEDILQYRSCHIVPIFVCGLLKEDESNLKMVFDIISNDTYLPHKVEMEMGVQYILENHNSHLLFRCLSEIDLDTKGNTFLQSILNWNIGHVCFSLPNCDDGCVKGLTAYLRSLDKICDCNSKKTHRNDLVMCDRMVKVTLQMMCLERRSGIYTQLIKSTCSSKHGGWLHVIHISSNGNSSPQLSSLFNMLSMYMGHCLHSLELQFLNVASTASINNFEVMTSTLQWLQCLILDECQSSYLVGEIVKQIPKTSRISNLKIYNSFLDDSACESVCSVVKDLQHLQTFHFSENVIQNDTPRFYQSLLEALECKKLQVLKLSHLPSKRLMARKDSVFPIDEESSLFVSPSINAILQNCALTHLSIYKSYLGENFLRVLSRALVSNPNYLQKLELQANHILSHEGLDGVLNALISLKDFQKLNLRATQLDESNLHVLVDLIKTSTTLKYLSLPAWAGFIDHLADAVGVNTSMEFLELRKLQFRGVGEEVTNLAAAIRHHPKLRTFRIGSNQTTPNDLQELIEAATSNKNMHSLMFVNFAMENDDLFYLAERIRVSKNICSLDIKGNKITEEVADKFYDCLQGRQKLMFMNISQSVVREAHCAVQRLKERVILLKVDWF